MALAFDKTGPKCYKIQTFYRICGHVITGYQHTDICVKAIAEGLTPADADLPFCWCPFSLGKHIQYVVGLCGLCQQGKEPGVTRDNEPHRNVCHGTHTTLALPDTRYTNEQIRALALDWRRKVEQQDRPTRIERLTREAEHDERRKAREAEWTDAWERHRRTTRVDFPAIGSFLTKEEESRQVEIFHKKRTAQILDLTDDYSRTREPHDLLEIAHDVGAEAECGLCGEDPSKPSSLFDEDEDKSVRFQGGCDHIFHLKCIIKSLTTANLGRRSCPQCRRLYQVVLKCAFDDPKYRWIMQHPREIALLRDIDTADHKLWQISGYIPFEAGLYGIGKGKDKDKNFFRLFEQEDRWGDREALIE